MRSSVMIRTHVERPRGANVAAMLHPPHPTSIAEFRSRWGHCGLQADPKGLAALVKKAGKSGVGHNFFSVTYPRIAALALRFDELFPHPIPMLLERTNSSITLTKLQCACLLSNCFLSTMGFDSRPEEPTAEFSELLKSDHKPDLAKLRCFVNYFERVTAPGYDFGPASVEIRRVFQPDAMKEMATWKESTKPIMPLQIAEGGIEESVMCVQADFANMYIGGGVICGGCVQEEIRFAESPECCVAMLVCPRMEPSEAILIHGVERFSKTKGYAFTLEFDQSVIDSTPRDATGTIQVAITAMDAVVFRRRENADQLRPEVILTQLRKALVAFSCEDGSFCRDRYSTVATGNWGCGAFLGVLELMAVVQIIAAGEARRCLRYHPFSQQRFEARLTEFVRELHSKHATVGQVAAALERACAICLGHLTAKRETDIHRLDIFGTVLAELRK